MIRLNRTAVVALSITWLFVSQVTQARAGESFERKCDNDVVVSNAKQDQRGILTHSVACPYQSDPTKIHVIVPSRDSDAPLRVLYLLPVEAQDGTRWGNPLDEILTHDLHNRHQLICVQPTFANLPWYADHPTDAGIRQESYFLKVVVPHIERTYPVLAKKEGRLLVGFSKSGWGAASLLLRHPDVFSRAAAFDAPLMMDEPNRYGMQPIFETQRNFDGYCLRPLFEKKAADLGGTTRLGLFGYGNFRAHHRQCHTLLEELKVPHVYRDGPQREHHWNSGWLAEAVDFLTNAD